MRPSSLLPCWQHFEMGREPKHVSCKLHEVKGFIFTCSHSRQICVFVFCLKILGFLTLFGELCQFCGGMNRESGASDIMRGGSACTSGSCNSWIFHCGS